MSDTNFTPIQNHRHLYSFVYSNLYVLRQQTIKVKFIHTVPEHFHTKWFSLFRAATKKYTTIITLSHSRLCIN
jgi:hypothetical protein